MTAALVMAYPELRSEMAAAFAMMHPWHRTSDEEAQRELGAAAVQWINARRVYWWVTEFCASWPGNRREVLD